MPNTETRQRPGATQIARNEARKQLFAAREMARVRYVRHLGAARPVAELMRLLGQIEGLDIARRLLGVD